MIAMDTDQDTQQFAEMADNDNDLILIDWEHLYNYRTRQEAWSVTD